MTAPNDDDTQLKQALSRAVQDEDRHATQTDVRPLLRRRFHEEQRPGTALYIAAQVVLLATLVAAGLWYWLY